MSANSIRKLKRKVDKQMRDNSTERYKYILYTYIYQRQQSRLEETLITNYKKMQNK